MIGSFKDEETRKIYKTGRSRRYGAIARPAARRLADIDFAQNVAELQDPIGQHFKRLQGNGAGQQSLRINEQYWIRFSWDGKDAQEVEVVDRH